MTQTTISDINNMSASEKIEFVIANNLYPIFIMSNGSIRKELHGGNHYEFIFSEMNADWEDFGYTRKHYNYATLGTNKTNLAPSLIKKLISYLQHLETSDCSETAKEYINNLVNYLKK